MAAVRDEGVAAGVPHHHTLDDGAPTAVAETVEVQCVPAGHRSGHGGAAPRRRPGLGGGDARTEPAQQRVPDVGGARAGQMDVRAAPLVALDPDVAGQVEHLRAGCDAPSGGDPRMCEGERRPERDGRRADGGDRAQVVPVGEALLVRRAGRGDREFVAGAPADGGGRQREGGVAHREVGGGAHPGRPGGTVQSEVAGAGDPEAGVVGEDRRAVAPEALLVDGGEAQRVDGALVGGQRESAPDLDVAGRAQGERASRREDERAARVDQE